MKLLQYFNTQPQDAPNTWLFPHPLAWATLAGMGTILYIWSKVTGFQFTSEELPSGLLPLSLPLFASIWCMYRKLLPVFSYFTFTLIFIIGVNVILKSGNCLGVAFAFPLVDVQMAAFDQMIGFDWPSHIRWVNDHALVSKILGKTYYSLNAIMLLTVLTLFAFHRYDQLKEILILVFFTGVATLILGAIWPAIGAYGYYDLAPADISNLPASAGRFYHNQFLAIRDGSLRALDLSHYKGLVQFPSFHTVMALLTTWAVRHTIIFWPMALINAVMIVSTLSYGGHHLADVFGGMAVTAFAIWVYRAVPDSYLSPAATSKELPDWLRKAIFRLTSAQRETV